MKHYQVFKLTCLNTANSHYILKYHFIGKFHLYISGTLSNLNYIKKKMEYLTFCKCKIVGEMRGSILVP